jgi:hypothetical protein
MSNDHVTIGRIDFGPRDSYTTLGALIDDIAADEELIEDLCAYAGSLLTEIEALKEGVLSL